MVKTCSKCSKPAVTFIRYNGTHLCNEHFLMYVIRRVKKEMRRQGKIPPNEKIGVAVSGGKDSLVTLHLLKELFSKRSDIKIISLTVDEGIKGYRDKSIPVVKRNCELLDVESHIISFKDVFGATMDEIFIKKPSQIGACSFCGVFRRFCLNTLAKKVGVNKLATGHNLDDISQSVLMNFVNADIEKLARLGPHRKIQPGLIPRLMPLRQIPEKENTLYALLKNIEFHDAECPYSHEALRGVFKEILYELEEKNPGTRHSILRSFDSIKEMLEALYPPSPLNICQRCGEPTPHLMCKACVLQDLVKDPC
ncbi:MAG: TIGR00269 family protein [Candidatus Thermoplasmatota archaeon]|nr:TIGR00269 family protein [Candidatus Thermoplasmatota archaeon]